MSPRRPLSRSRRFRVAAGGFTHETSTFTPVKTSLADFDNGYGFFRGTQIFERLTGTNVPMGGFIEAAARQGFELCPLLWTFAYTSGPSNRKTYDEIKREFLSRLEAVLPVDGVLLDQHGAFLVEGIDGLGGIDDADGDILESVRNLVGPDCPVVAVFDLHSNHTPRRVASADAIIGFDTFPHVDEAERGREAADLMMRIVSGDVAPTSALVQLPLYWHPTRQVSGLPPFSEVIDHLHALETERRVLTATIATGFPFADVPDRGPSVIVVTDDDQAAADRYARDLGSWIWSRRRSLLAPLVSVEEGLARGEAEGHYPIILADHADNTGGGAPGDSTEVLRTFLDCDLRDAIVLYMVDPQAAAACHRAGVGATINLAVGGKSHPAQGPPLEMQAEVLALSNGRFVYDGPMLAGLEGSLGPAAAIREKGVTVVCVSRPMQPYDQSLCRTLGIDCSSMRYICVKSVAHFRSGFASLAGSIQNVDAAGVHTFDLGKLSYHKKRELMFGVDVFT